MFGLKRARMEDAMVPTSEVTEIVPFPTGRIPRRLIEAEGQKSYEEVAEALGFAPAELVRAQLLAFFEEAGITLYDYGQVSAWLTKKKAESDAELKHWHWSPLRKKDFIDYDWGDCGKDGFYHHCLCSPYKHLVPLHALEKAGRIEAKFRDKVKFFVSDYTSPRPDPFIMVRPAAENLGSVAEYNLVFDFWNEPGFGV